jgi:hypothetical protein
MAIFSRDEPHESIAANQVEDALLTYPFLHQCGGITFNELLNDHSSRLKCYTSLWCATELLAEEGKVIFDVFAGKVYPLKKLL